MVGILIDAKFADSIWCKSMYKSLKERLRQKRISFCEISDYYSTDFEAIFILASSREWTSDAIKQLNAYGIYPILICNQAENLPGCIYSCVCTDIHASMKNLLDTLKIKNKTRIALYGINTDSISDIDRVNSLFHWKEQYPVSLQIFYNNGSLENCFTDFFSHIHDYDAAICANGFVAVSLIRRIKEMNPSLLDNFYVINCSETELTKYYQDSLLSLDLHFEQYGDAAVYIFELLQKNTYLSTMTIKILWSLKHDTVASEPHDIPLHLKASTDAFYDDMELREMQIVDKLLKFTDEIEKKIIDCLMKNYTMEEIADACFLTVGGVKYRIKKILADSGAQDKTQIVELLKKYII